MSQKIRVAVLFGGESAEHAVSLESGKNIADALDRNKYDVHLIGLDKKGVMRSVPSLDILRKTDVAKPIDLESIGQEVFIVPGPNKTAEILELASGKRLGTLDAVFPILHGPYGEDGTMQGYLRLLGLPFVGPGVLGSAVGMDKDVTKRLLAQAGLPIPKFVALKRHETKTHDFKALERELGLPFFLKPANMGSSVGVHKIATQDKFAAALKDAFQYDTKVMVEEFIQGREIECAVLGNKDVVASVPGEVMPQHEFYSYEAKYLDANGASLAIPAELSAQQVEQVKTMALKVFRTLECEGLSRIDFFLKKDGQLLVNEINTIPGFTKISMYPKMMGATGVGYSDLIDKLITLAMERTKEERGLKK
ncbi:MAG: D-alanine--D-alanine ligase [Bdellovibrionota bacterium]